ncbi:peptidase, m36 (fungalysin) family protein [Candidatus Nitrosopumilus koreensis AR1]|uniref:Peptidase, m36 (Fungalysin) family protein n=1 Tax=Candidatus Nitrosopumilus koreensis AR1 TaxID=1229908 RepID=K0B772_9ARCH|nr:peptidase, m36 (fungalysin) family protein [Candidatus Nitrosopumilus koreensis AR1]
MFVVIGVSDSFAQQIESIDVVENKMVTLLGEGFDADHDKLVFKWVQIYGEPVVLSSYSIPEPTFMAPTVANGEIKVLTFELTVTDPIGASHSDIVEVVVNPVNHAPQVDAGRDKVALPGVHVMSIFPSAHDPDGDVLTYQWKQTGGQEVELVYTDNKHITFQPIYLDFSDFEPLSFQVTVDDGFGGTATDSVNVYLFSNLIDNRRITVDAGPLQTVYEGERVTLTATGQTVDGSDIRFSWVQLLGPSASISSFIGPEVEFIAPQVGDTEKLLSFQVTGYSPGNGYANALAMVKVLPSNGSPIADAGPNQNVPENVLVKLLGTGTDPDGDSIRYSWSQKSGPVVKFYERASFSIYFFSPQISSDSETLVFELTVTDVHGNSDSDDVNIVVTNRNSPPNASAGPDRRVVSGSPVTIIGSGSDADGDPLTFSWKQLSGDLVTFDKSGKTLSFVAPEVMPSESKRLSFQLTVTDTADQKAFDQVVVFVSPENSAPTATVSDDRTVDENTLVNIMCSGTDPDGDALTFSWSSSSNVVFTEPSSGNTLVKTPNVVGDSKIILTCTVSDGTLSASDSLTLTVRNTLNLDIVADAGNDMIVNEKIQVSLDGRGSHDPENQPLSYSWTQIAGEAVTLSSKSSVTPIFTTPTVANGEIKVLVFELKVFDNNGRQDTDTVKVTVDPVNATPVASASAEQNLK